MMGEGANVALPFLKVFSVTCGAFVSLDKAGDVGKRLFKILFYFNFQIVHMDFDFAYQSPLGLLLLLLSLTRYFQVVAGTVWYSDSSD